MQISVPIAFALVLAAAVPSPAQQLPGTVRPEHYDLAWTIDLGHERFEGSETIHVQMSAPTTRVVLNAVDLQLRDVTIRSGAASQNAIVTPDPARQTAVLTVAKAIPTGAADLRIRFSGRLNDELRGLYLSKTNNRKYAVTQFESTDARRAFPCFDEPAFKATFALTVTLDQRDIAISNGKLLSDTPGPGAGRHTMKFATTPKMSSYLVAIAAGDFQCLSGSADNVPIRICATPDKRELGHIALTEAERILRFYNHYYAIRYPFGKLDIVAVPDFAAGAMENTAAIFFREADLLADSNGASVATRKRVAGVLAHEMAHQWFGDLVTMQWWDDVWLNEGFATWMANKPLAAAHRDWKVDVDEAVETQHALELDALQATHPIHADVQTPAEIDEFFDSITYEKGASVLRMVEHYVGADTFRRGVNAYLEAHAYGSATSEDFWKALSSASGRPVERILPTFVNVPGFPLLDVSLACTGNRTTVTVRQQRFTLGNDRSGEESGSGRPSEASGAGGSSAPGGSSGATAAQASSASGVSARAGAAQGSSGGGRWQVPVCLKTPGRVQAGCEIVGEASHTITLENVCAPWVFVNTGAQGYFRTAYSSDILRAIAPRVGAELTASERLSLIGDEWALVRAGRHSAADYLTLVAGYGHEESSGVLEEVSTRLAFIHEHLADDAARPQLEAFIRSVFAPVAAEVGLQPAPGDSDDRRALRAAVVDMLGTIAEDSGLVATARRLVDRALAGGAPLEPTLADAMVRIAARHGDARLFDEMAAAAERAGSPEERYRYLNALTGFREPGLVDRALQRALSPDMRSQDVALYLEGFFRNPAARSRAWAFLRAHWKELEPKLTIFGGDTRVVSAFGRFCDAESRQAVKSFTSTHPLPAASRTLDQTLERIEECRALRERQAPAVAEWLARP